MRLSRSCCALCAAALLLVASCSDPHPSILAPVATESLVTVARGRAVIPNETLPNVRVSSSGTDIVVEVSRPDLCVTVVSALGAREGDVVSVVAEVSPNPLARCVPNVPVSWVVDYRITVPRLDTRAWKVRVFERGPGAEPVFLTEQQVKVR